MARQSAPPFTTKDCHSPPCASPSSSQSRKRNYARGRSWHIYTALIALRRSARRRAAVYRGRCSVHLPDQTTAGGGASTKGYRLYRAQAVTEPTTQAHTTARPRPAVIKQSRLRRAHARRRTTKRAQRGQADDHSSADGGSSDGGDNNRTASHPPPSRCAGRRGAASMAAAQDTTQAPSPGARTPAVAEAAASAASAASTASAAVTATHTRPRKQ